MIQPKIYGICIFSGIVLLYLILFIFPFTKNIFKNVSEEKIINSFIALYISGFIGGRLFYLIFDEKYFNNINLSKENIIEHLINFFNFTNGGFSVQGSALLGLITYIIIYNKYKKYKQTCSIIPISVLFIHSFGRLGCYFNSCCNGLIFTFPLQILSFFLYLISFLFGINLYKKNISAFNSILYYISIVNIERILFDPFRFDKELLFIIQGYPIYKYQFIGIIILYIIILIRFIKNNFLRKSYFSLDSI